MKSNKLFRWIPNGIICLVVVALLFGYIGSKMGTPQMLNTIMKTAHDLLLNTVFYLMAICVITGLYPKIGIVRPIMAEIPVRILKGFVLVLSSPWL